MVSRDKNSIKVVLARTKACFTFWNTVHENGIAFLRGKWQLPATLSALENIYIYRKGEEGEKIVRLYGDVTIFRFLSSILSLLLLYSFFFTPQERGFLSLFLSYNFFFVSSYFILLSLYFHYFILLCFFLFHHGGNKYFFPLIERLLNNFHPFGFIRFALSFFQFPLLISSSLFFFFFFFFLFLSQSSIAGNPFVSLASLSHWLFPHGRANFDESLTSYSFHGLIWFYRRINSLARRDFRYARDDDIVREYSQSFQIFIEFLLLGETSQLSDYATWIAKITWKSSELSCWNMYI